MKARKLPIDQVIPDIVKTLRQEANLVVLAPPGAGKTTRIGPALINEGLIDKAMILLQPRRVAARATTERIAKEQNWQLGNDVGWQVRFEKKLTKKTKLQVLTEGILTRRLQHDPFLEDVSLVMLDEFHLRSIDGDMALAFLREIQETVRPELKIVVASATLAAKPVATFLGDCPVIKSEGRLFPLHFHYETPWRTKDNRSLAERVRDKALTALKKNDDGHILVFLPGVGEINRAKALLADESQRPVLTLHGSLPAAEQDRAINPIEPSIILATNVAETSLTIEGVTTVIDSGWQRIPFYSPATGLTKLERKRISQDSAKQRAGRAGRTREGRVFRLWTESEQRGLLATTPPEVSRVGLCRTILELYVWGTKPQTFNWFERPSDSVIESGTKLLQLLGAIKDDEVTDLGRKLLQMPLHPRLGLMMLSAKKDGIIEDGAILAALISEPDIVDWSLLPENFVPCPSDVLFRLELLRSNDNCLKGGRVAQVKRASKEIVSSLTKDTKAPSRSASEDRLLKLLFKAYPDRLAKRRKEDRERALMVGGHGLRLWSKSRVKKGDYLLAIEIAGGKGESLCRQASLVKREFIPTVKVLKTIFSKLDERVQRVEREMYEDLCLEERVIPLEREEAALTLAHNCAKNIEKLLMRKRETKEFIARVNCLREWLPELALPDFSLPGLQGLLPEICHCVEHFSYEGLRKFPIMQFLQGKLTYSQSKQLAELAPERLQVPSGIKVKLVYAPGSPPILRVQLQNLFGLADTPRIAQGQVAVLLHLLAPNGRPVQVTDDLRNFWNETYPQVRKELRGRYAKHSWPEDPWNAQALSRPKRRKE